MSSRVHPGLCEQFARDLVGAAPPSGTRLALWRLADRSSRYLPNSLAVPAVGADNAADWYISPALAPPDLIRKARVSNETAVGLLGLHLDLDLAGTPDGRGGTRKGAPSEAAAVELARAIHPPTVTVATGGGWQPWWIFREPWIFGDAAERLEARALLIAWQAAHRDRIRWPIDSTHDLARVLRLPGTVNAKDPENPRPVTYTGGGPRITSAVARGFVEQYHGAALVTAQTMTSFRTAPGAASVAFASIPASVEVRDERLLRLLDTPGPGGDVSSGDFAVAARAVRLGYDDRAAAALVADHRERAGDPKNKAGRLDYLVATVRAARAEVESKITGAA